MAKTIHEQIADMEARCNQLEELQKLFEKMVKNEFGIDAKKIHKILDNNEAAISAFEKKIGSYFDLKSTQDFDDFLKVFCTENSLNYFNKKRFDDSVSVAEQGQIESYPQDKFYRKGRPVPWHFEWFDTTKNGGNGR